MALDFQTRDVIHNIVARYVHAFLPDAKKPYNLKAEFQPELDVHGIASKAEVYNIATDPKVTEEGMNAAMELIYYLVADGYRVKTPLFNLRMLRSTTLSENGLTWIQVNQAPALQD
jgi:hypothetical protein